MDEIIEKIFATGKGVLAADESETTANLRLEAVNVEGTEENRRAYRSLFLETRDLEKYISGVILHDETIRSNGSKGESFVKILKEKGIVPGIKVDKGLEDFSNNNEKYTKGLDGLPERLEEYYQLGARFTKWRSVYNIDPAPSEEQKEQISFDFAKYCKMVIDTGMIPIVEPEVLMDGDHSIEKSAEVTMGVLNHLFRTLLEHEVDLKHVILKTSFVISGKDAAERANPETVARMSAEILIDTCPPELGGIVFLSGGQSTKEASDNLEALVNRKESFSWPVTFSYARAIQSEPLKLWAGKTENIEKSREVFLTVLEELKKDLR